jgi:hypothetical protein
MRRDLSMEYEELDDEGVGPLDEHPVRRPKWATTEAQRAARRENGRKGGASRQTPEGRARSDEARVTHGAYAHRVRLIKRGLLREDPEDAKAFLASLIQAYQPANPREDLVVSELASLRWRRERLMRFEVGGLSALSSKYSGPVSGFPDFLLHLYERGRTAFRELHEREVPVAELKAAAAMLNDHPNLDPSAWEGVPDEPTREDYETFIRRSVDQVFDGDFDAAIAWANEQTEQRAREVAADLEPAADEASLAAVTDRFTTNLTRVDSHLDRAIKRAEDRLEALRTAERLQTKAEEE